MQATKYSGHGTLYHHILCLTGGAKKCYNAKNRGDYHKKFFPKIAFQGHAVHHHVVGQQNLLHVVVAMCRVGVSVRTGSECKWDLYCGCRARSEKLGGGAWEPRRNRNARLHLASAHFSLDVNL